MTIGNHLTASLPELHLRTLHTLSRTNFTKGRKVVVLVLLNNIKKSKQATELHLDKVLSYHKPSQTFF